MSHVDNPFQSPVILSFCPGMLGLERGLERAIETLWGNGGNQGEQENLTKGNKTSVTIAAYVEIEAFICWNLVNQMEKGVLAPAPVWADLKTFPAGQFHGKVHGILGGYPCQPFSVAGQQGGESDPRHLWPFIREHVRAVRPIWCWFENVPNHINIGYRTVREDLQALGYTVKEGLYSAQEVGAPHLRKRIFILAVENSYCQSDGNNKRRIYTKITSAGPDVGHPAEQGLQKPRYGGERELSEEEGTRLDDRLKFPGNEFGNTQSEYEGSCTRKDGQIKSGRPGSLDHSHGIGPEPEHSVQTGRDGIVSAGQDVSNAQFKGLEGCIKNSGQPPQSQSWNCGFPAGPGREQYQWEHPRVKSVLDFAINGYNFREDLLRMAGNGVVEQTAEIAFIGLLKKHRLI